MQLLQVDFMLLCITYKILQQVQSGGLLSHLGERRSNLHTGYKRFQNMDGCNADDDWLLSNLRSPSCGWSVRRRYLSHRLSNI